MSLQKVIYWQKNFEKNSSLVNILSATDEKAGSGIVSQWYGSGGSIPKLTKCHGSTTLVPNFRGWATPDLLVTSGTGLTLMPEYRCQTEEVDCRCRTNFPPEWTKTLMSESVRYRDERTQSGNGSGTGLRYRMSDCRWRTSMPMPSYAHFVQKVSSRDRETIF